MKKIISMILYLTLIFSVSSTAFAVSNETITIEEYSIAIKEAYAQYGVDVEILDYDENIVLTREMLNTALEGVEDFVNSIEISETETHVNTIASNQIGMSPSVMPVTKTVYKIWTISNLYGSADMRTEVTATTDVQISNVMSISSYSSYQYGLMLNFVSWTTTSETATRNSPSGGYVRVTVKGLGTFSYADPVTSITTGYTSEFSKTFDCWIG